MADNTNHNEATTVTITEEDSKSKEVNVPNKLFKVKTVSGVLFIITIIMSLPILASVVWLLYMKDYDCENLLKLPKFQVGIGIGMIFVFLISNIAVLLRSRFPVPSFFVVMVPLMLMLTMGLALVGSYKLESRKILATPLWFKEMVRDDNNWENIKSCIYSKEVCNELVSRSLNLEFYDFSMKTLTYIESGCCKPPAMCGMQYVNATFWRKSDKLTIKPNPDCEKWANDQNVLCYDCESCKDGFVRIMESKWRKLGFFLTLMAIFLIISHLLLFISVMWSSIIERS